MFAKAGRRHRDETSHNTDPASNPTPVSPLGERFDLGRDSDAHHNHYLHSPISNTSRPSADSVRRRTGDGLRQSTVSLQPPILPPIPRVASRHETERKEQRAGSQEEEKIEQEVAEAVRPVAEENPSITLSTATLAPALPIFEIPSSTMSEYPEITFDEPRMEATMFPRPEPPPPSDPFTTGPPMSRSFVDSRDKPYSHSVQRPPAIASSHSSPDALTPRSAAIQGLRPPGLAATVRSSDVSLDSARKTPSTTGTNYSGSTARPSIQSAKSASASPLQTIGTPYSETSASFPAPQHVATRPKTIGSSSTIAGVMVPTHHTNGQNKELGKPEKRKTRLLNPMALLVRRRSAQDPANIPNEAERRAHAQAQARQKSVASAGVSTIPEDFDPRIRGKIVHDFNAPRPRRTFSSNDVNFDGAADRQLQSADSMPAMPSSSDNDQQRPSMHSAHRSDVSSRHSRHTPIFIEHLYEEPNGDGHLNAVQAERLENKDFLKRASHHSKPSEESSVLPPFARRSQQLDPMQASFYRDDDSSKRSSDRSSVGKRESNSSSGPGVSPIAARHSSSPVSPDATDRTRRPLSDMSMIGGKFDTPSNNMTFDRQAGADVANNTADSYISKTAIDTNNTTTPPPQQNGQLPSNSSPIPKGVHPALRDFSAEVPSPRSAYFDSTPAHSSPALGSSIMSTPEPAVAQAAVAYQPQSSPPKLVEKLATAVGHSKAASSSLPKHAASNASRFSFQLDASAAEEKALEDKHRRVNSSQTARKKNMVEVNVDDEDDYFDEDAMDDEDEMEAETRLHDDVGGHGAMPYLGANVPMLQHQPRSQEPRSDASSVYDEDAIAPRRDSEVPYAEHPAFRGHSAVYSSKHNSMAPSSHYSGDVNAENKDSWTPHHHRFMSDATVMTLADSESGMGGPGVSGSNFYMQPQAAGYETVTSAHGASTLGFNRNSTISASTVQSDGGAPRGAMNNETLQATQLSPRFGDFKFVDSPERSRPATSDDFRTTSAMATAHTSMASPNGLPPAPVTSPLVQPSAESHAYGNDDRQDSAAYHGSIGMGIRARNVSTNQNLQYAAPSESGTESTHDEMYFDDGGFSEDVQNSSGYGESINEDQFDHPDFAGGFRGMEPRGYHERHASAMTITSRDGPYPSFAMPNAGKAHLRQSQLLLDDLPLQGPDGTQWAPQRNSSEDAKRLGLSDRVPPLPAPAGSVAAASQMAAYHQALADAANRAADDGRFQRDGSVSSNRSSNYSAKGSPEKTDRDSASMDDKGRYSRATDYSAAHVPVESARTSTAVADANGDGLGRTATINRSASSARYTLPRMSGFDFGFNWNEPPADDSNSNGTAAPTDNHIFNAAPSDDININAAPIDDYGSASHLDDSYSDGYDDDFIAAANADALAYDDSGFYGQEFGFYARARSDSTGSNSKNNKGGHGHQQQPVLEAINGGFFGEDGDDPLRRQKSSREPDLTPITERSEFSARNSFINFGPASAGWGHGHAGIASPALARLPLSPLVSGSEGPNKSSRASGGGYFGVFPPAVQNHQPFIGVGQSPVSATNTNSPARPPWTTSDSPVSATSSSSRGALPFANAQAAPALGVNISSAANAAAVAAVDPDATPRKPLAQGVTHGSSPLSEPGTAKKVPLQAGVGGVTPSREAVSPEGKNSGHPPRWTLERKGTGEGVGGREAVGPLATGGWI